MGVAASSSQVTLPFMLQTMPRGEVTVQFRASLPGGVAEVDLPSQMQAAGGLVFDESNFKIPSDIIAKVCSGNCGFVRSSYGTHRKCDIVQWLIARG